MGPAAAPTAATIPPQERAQEKVSANKPEDLSPQEMPKTLTQAIAKLRPLMSDERERLSMGATALALWSIDGMRWDELKTLPKTTTPRVMKDAEEERGKLICPSGGVIEIAVERVDGHKLYIGGIGDEAQNIYRFVNVGSSGDIVAHSRAAMCGVVIGRFDYANSVGGISHAVQLVGMFNLPENKRMSSL